MISVSVLSLPKLIIRKPPLLFTWRTHLLDLLLLLLLYKSVPVPGKANSILWKSQTVKALETAHGDHIEIISVVGDGLKALVRYEQRRYMMTGSLSIVGHISSVFSLSTLPAICQTFHGMPSRPIPFFYRGAIWCSIASPLHCIALQKQPNHQNNHLAHSQYVIT
jgi:hypothetical protein